MLFVVVAALAGVAWGLLSTSGAWLGAPLRAVIDVAARFCGEGSLAALGALGAPPQAGWVHGLAGLAAATAPSLLCLVLVEVVRGTRSTRHAGAALLLTTAMASFLVLPAATASALLVLAFVSALLLLVPGRAVLAPFAFLALAVGSYVSVTVLTGASPYVDHAADALSLSGGAPGLWRLAVVAVALVPLVGATRRLLTSR